MFPEFLKELPGAFRCQWNGRWRCKRSTTLDSRRYVSCKGDHDHERRCLTLIKLKADNRSRGRSRTIASTGAVLPFTATPSDRPALLHERPDRPLVGGGLIGRRPVKGRNGECEVNAGNLRPYMLERIRLSGESNARPAIKLYWISLAID
jgi:hypothetical protein